MPFLKNIKPFGNLKIYNIFIYKNENIMSFLKINKKTHINDLKIYIVDDEEYYLNIVKASLNKFGYNDIKLFLSGEDCISEIKNEKPDCIILDYLLKNGENGNNILKSIKKINDDIDIIILSGQEDITIATDIIKDGAYDYVVKNKMTYFNLNSNLISIRDKKIYKKTLDRVKKNYIWVIVSVWVIGLTSLIYYITKF